MIHRYIVTAVFALASMSTSLAVAAAPGALRVGAAKIEITPATLTKLEPMAIGGGDFDGVHDPIYARALVLDSGSGAVALVAVETIHLTDTMPLRQRIQSELGIQADHIMITATHSHSSPQLLGGGPFWRPVLPEQVAYAEATNDKIIAVLKQAKAAMQPARMGLGVGAADVNVNRDQFGGGGYNAAGKSDKTVWVLRFDALNGDPIAILFNYAVHSDVTLGTNLITGDLVGAAAHVIERNYGEKAIALFTMGDGGDQAAKFHGNGKRIERRAPPAAAAAQAPASPNAVPGGGGGGAGAGGGAGGGGRPKMSPEAMAERRSQVFPAAEGQGYMLGSEVLRVASQIDTKTTAPVITAAESAVVCPVKPDKHHDVYTFQDFSDGVTIRLGVVLIDKIALAWVSGEVVNNIDTHLKSLTPLSNTIMVTLANGRSGYLVDDAGYYLPTLEVNAATAEKGCAENGIVDGLITLINKTSAMAASSVAAR